MIFITAALRESVATDQAVILNAATGVAVNPIDLETASRRYGDLMDMYEHLMLTPIIAVGTTIAQELCKFQLGDKFCTYHVFGAHVLETREETQARLLQEAAELEARLLAEEQAAAIAEAERLAAEEAADIPPEQEPIVPEFPGKFNTNPVIQ